MVEEIKEIAKILEAVSGDARQVLIWWFVWKVTLATLLVALGTFVVVTASKLIRLAMYCNYTYPKLLNMAGMHTHYRDETVEAKIIAIFQRGLDATKTS